MIRVFTIGYTHKTAEKFFTLLSTHNVETLIDIRLNNKSQLASFTKEQDLEYFLDKICKIKYLYLPYLAPTSEILDAYKKKEIQWDEYEIKFNNLLKERKIETVIDSKILQNSCFLCSEEYPNKCHRRLVAEYLKRYFKEITITHL